MALGDFFRVPQEIILPITQVARKKGTSSFHLLRSALVTYLALCEEREAGSEVILRRRNQNGEEEEMFFTFE